GSPGSLAQNYSVGAYGPDGRIADFSSRGGEDGLVKPDISAPGVAVRSAVPGDRYALGDGTSMAAPHVAAAVALLWSAAPDLVGEVDQTRAMLDASAVDTPDPQCGGTPGDNNVYGEGKLDALALLDRAPVAGSARGATTARTGCRCHPGRTRSACPRSATSRRPPRSASPPAPPRPTRCGWRRWTRSSSAAGSRTGPVRAGPCTPRSASTGSPS